MLSVTDPDLAPPSSSGGLQSWLRFAAYVTAIVLAYSALSERVARMEERQEIVRDELREIRTDVKMLLRRP